MVKMRRFGFFFLGAMVGGALGAALALLIAPSSGFRLRESLCSGVGNVVEEVKKAAAERRDALELEISHLRTPR